MSPVLRKPALAAHLTFTVGWIGTVIAYLALGAAASTSQDAHTMRGAWIAMELIGWYVIVPLALGSVLTGLLMAFGTRWGLLRHHWVLISFGLTVFAAGVLVAHMPTVSSQADLARRADTAQLEALGGDLLHPGIGLIVLGFVLLLNIYKPRGMTKYGQRKARQERDHRHAPAEPASEPTKT